MVKRLHTSHKINWTALLLRDDKLTFELYMVNDHIEQTNLPYTEKVRAVWCGQNTSDKPISRFKQPTRETGSYNEGTC
jgi:hypothetical protein